MRYVTSSSSSSPKSPSPSPAAAPTTTAGSCFHKGRREMPIVTKTISPESSAPIFASPASAASWKASPAMKSATVSPTLAIAAAIARSPVPKSLASGATPSLTARRTSSMIPSSLPTTSAASTVSVSGPIVSRRTPALARVKKNMPYSTTEPTASSNSCSAPPSCAASEAAASLSPLFVRVATGSSGPAGPAGRNGTMIASASAGWSAAEMSPTHAGTPAKRM
mmetsp:Transcript_21812/g.54379  ORF Transcript_21812/g.54379 Transcript_21812/m.54379 type:complete len:223 (-) Transcript_21812:345-1013(-)